MKCGKCSASCPSFDEMEYHPHQFVAMVTKGDIDRLMASPPLQMSVLLCLRGALPPRRRACGSGGGNTHHGGAASGRNLFFS